MDGIILLADGTELSGKLSGNYSAPVAGLLAANTAIVGFQEMLTDPVYQNTLLALTYPEIGNTGATEAFAESPSLQPKAVIVREICSYPSHYRSETSLPDYITGKGGIYLSGIDTRWLGVYLREKGETPAVIAEASHDPEDLKDIIKQVQRPVFNGYAPPPDIHTAKKYPRVHVVNLGIRHSFARQLAECCHPNFFPYDTDAETLLKDKPDAVIVSDGPAFNLPPAETVNTLQAVAGRCPVFACGLGNIALGMAFGGDAGFLHRGHHGANYPVRHLKTGKVHNSSQRHSVVLNGESVQNSSELEPAYVNVNDGSIEGVMTRDGTAVGYQPLTPCTGREGINHIISDFIDRIVSK